MAMKGPENTIFTHLRGEVNKKACLHVLKGEAQKLARLGAKGIRIGSEGSVGQTNNSQIIYIIGCPKLDLTS